MIGYLEGKVIDIDQNHIIININGCGYNVSVPKNYDLILNQNISLFIYTNIKETEFSLFGFLTKTELEIFKKIISISGIGPKIGIDILSCNPDKFLNAIETEDIAFITQIPGIGKKSASRIILELKGKIDNFNVDTKINTNKDVIDTLVDLGYNKKNITDLLSNLDKEFDSDEELITYCIKNLN